MSVPWYEDWLISTMTASTIVLGRSLNSSPGMFGTGSCFSGGVVHFSGSGMVLSGSVVHTPCGGVGLDVGRIATGGAVVTFSKASGGLPWGEAWASGL